MRIRPAETAEPVEVAGAYAVCLRTADSGADGRHLFADPDLVGHNYVGPYLTYPGATCWVVADESGSIHGYCLAVPDTLAFESWAEEHWWPRLREKYAVDDAAWTDGDRWMAARIRSGVCTDDGFARDYPGHAHIDLLPEAQGRGLGGQHRIDGRRLAGIGANLDRRRPRSARGPRSAALRAVHPVTMWRGRLDVALDALGTDAAVRRRSPVETTNVQLPTGDRLQIPTAAETLRMKSFLVLCRGSRADFTGLADLADAVGLDNAALTLAGVDRYYSAGRPERLWIATQLVRRLADPIPSDDDYPSGPEAEAAWDDVRRRCLSLAVAILEEAS